MTYQNETRDINQAEKIKITYQIETYDINQAEK